MESPFCVLFNVKLVLLPFMQFFLEQYNFVAGANKNDNLKFSEVQFLFQKEARVVCALPYVVSISDEKLEMRI